MQSLREQVETRFTPRMESLERPHLQNRLRIFTHDVSTPVTRLALISQVLAEQDSTHFSSLTAHADALDELLQVFKEDSSMQRAVLHIPDEVEEDGIVVRDLAHNRFTEERHVVFDEMKSSMIRLSSDDALQLVCQRVQKEVDAIGRTLVSVSESKVGKDLYDVVRRESDRGIHMIPFLLSEVTKSPYHPRQESFPMDMLFESAEEYLHKKRNVQIEGWEESKVRLQNHTLNTDPGLLHVILDNLLENAEWYSKSSIRVDMDIANIDGAQFLTLSIENDGKPIAKDQQKSIWNLGERGTNAAVHSTGAGLYLVKRAVDALRGTRSLRSEPVEGEAEGKTVVRISIPLGTSSKTA
jgi:signal transduction histidine kinase